MSERSANRVLALIGFIVAVVVAGALGALASLRAPAFYLSLARPSWAPPPWLFGPVWSLLYVLIAVSAYLVYSSTDTRRRFALAVWWVQLVVNAAWTWLFFSLHSGIGALADIGLLAVLIATLIVACWRIRPLAGALLVPYLVWVLFATALTVSVWSMNPALL